MFARWRSRRRPTVVCWPRPTWSCAGSRLSQPTTRSVPVFWWKDIQPGYIKLIQLFQAYWWNNTAKIIKIAVLLSFILYMYIYYLDIFRSWYTQHVPVCRRWEHRKQVRTNVTSRDRDIYSARHSFPPPLLHLQKTNSSNKKDFFSVFLSPFDFCSPIIFLYRLFFHL